MISEYWKRFFEDTGEIRPPRKGEWFLAQGMPDKAYFDFTEQFYPIITPKLIEDEIREGE